MIYLLAGLLFGSLVPYMARRFAKFMPATPAYAIYRIFKQPKKVKEKNEKYKSLLKAYKLRSLIFALITAALSYAVFWRFGGSQGCFWLVFLWTLILLSEIDIKMQLLPDILTFPLLIFGFLFAVCLNDYVTALDSAVGALFGYFMPVAASFLMLAYSKDAFGGGDIKLMAAIGAWFGMNALLTTVLLACFLFGLYALIKGVRVGAFGPALSLAAIIVLLFFL